VLFRSILAELFRRIHWWCQCAYLFISRQSKDSRAVKDPIGPDGMTASPTARDSVYPATNRGSDPVKISIHLFPGAGHTKETKICERLSTEQVSNIWCTLANCELEKGSRLEASVNGALSCPPWMEGDDITMRGVSGGGTTRDTELGAPDKDAASSQAAETKTQT
jgi:hypothetical protein